MEQQLANLVASGATSVAGRGIGAVGAIWAQDWNRVLGRDGGMCWHVPADYRFFKATTLGHPVIMGRASFQALGKALPGRRNIVLSRSSDFSPAEAEVAPSLEAALDLVAGSPQVWICGGGNVYEQALPYCDLLVVSQLDLEVSQAPGARFALAPAVEDAAEGTTWHLDQNVSDQQWREKSGDARWRVKVYRR